MGYSFLASYYYSLFKKITTFVACSYWELRCSFARSALKAWIWKQGTDVSVGEKTQMSLKHPSLMTRIFGRFFSFEVLNQRLLSVNYAEIRSVVMLKLKSTSTRTKKRIAVVKSTKIQWRLLVAINKIKYSNVFNCSVLGGFECRYQLSNESSKNNFY